MVHEKTRSRRKDSSSLGLVHTFAALVTKAAAELALSHSRPDRTVCLPAPTSVCAAPHDLALRLWTTPAMVQSHSLFFYGTLCHAAVLRRVIGNDGQHLTCRDAVLEDHVRLHVTGEGAHTPQFLAWRTLSATQAELLNSSLYRLPGRRIGRLGRERAVAPAVSRGDRATRTGRPSPRLD